MVTIRLLFLSLFVFLCSLPCFAEQGDLKWVIGGLTTSTHGAFTRLSADNQKLLLANGGIRIHNCKTGQYIADLPLTTRDDRWNFVEFSTDGNNLILLNNSKIEIWDIKSATQTIRFDLIQDGKKFEFMNLIKPSKKDVLLAIGNWGSTTTDTIITVWDINTRTCIKTIYPDSSFYCFPETFSVSQNGNIFYLQGYSLDGKYENAGWLFDINTGKVIKNTEIYNSLFFSNDDRYFIGVNNSYFSTGFDIVDLNSTKILKHFSTSNDSYDSDFPYESNKSRLNFSDDSKNVVFIDSADPKKVNIYNIEKDNIISTVYPKFADYYNDVYMFGDTVLGTTLSSYGAPCISEIQNAYSGEYLRTIINPSGGISRIKFTPDSKYMAVTYNGGGLYIFETETARLIARNFLLSNFDIPITAFAPNDNLIACKTDTCLPDTEIVQNSINIWNYKTGEIINTAYRGELNSFQFSGDCKYLASGDNSGRIYLWNTKTLTASDSLKNDQPIFWVCFTNDNSKLIALSVVGMDEYLKGDGVLITWDFTNGTVSRDTLKGINPGLSNLMHTISDDKQYFSSNDGVYDLIEKKMVLSVPQELSGLIFSNAISQDGNQYAMSIRGGFGSTFIGLIDVKTNETLKEYTLEEYFPSETNNPPDFMGVSFTPDGKYLAAANSDGTIFLFDLSDFTGVKEEPFILRESFVYPNPANDKISIEVKNTCNGGVIKVYNELGREMTGLRTYFDVETSNIIDLDTANLPEGVYFVKYQQEGRVLVSRFVVLRSNR